VSNSGRVEVNKQTVVIDGVTYEKTTIGGESVLKEVSKPKYRFELTEPQAQAVLAALDIMTNSDDVETTSVFWYNFDKGCYESVNDEYCVIAEGVRSMIFDAGVDGAYTKNWFKDLV
jgi:hypothetical protein